MIREAGTGVERFGQCHAPWKCVSENQCRIVKPRGNTSAQTPKALKSIFAREIFRHGIPRRVALTAWIFGGINGNFFAPDRILISRAGNAVAMEELRDAIDDFSDSLANTTWRRPDAGLRISPRRLRLIAGDY